MARAFLGVQKTISKDLKVIAMPDITPEQAWQYKTKYDPSMNQTMFDMFSKGRTPAQIACALSISVGTLYEWAKVHEDVRLILDLGKTKSLAWWQTILQRAALKEIEVDAKALTIALKSFHKEDFALSDSSTGNVTTINNNHLTLTSDQAKQRLAYLLQKKVAETG